MYQGKLRKVILILLLLYTALTFYFLYFGFGRASFLGDSSMRYNFMPTGIPLHLPIGRNFKIWFFELGNFVAFIPFGIIIPLLFRCNFIRFIALFIVSITVLETLQMLSRLGSFDIDDIIINTLGAAVGFWAQRLVYRNRDQFKGIVRICLIAIVIAIGVIVSVGGINNYLEKGGGKVVALNELTIKEGFVRWDESLPSFTTARENVQPQMNVYSRQNPRTNEFTYFLNGKYTRMTGNAAILNDEIKTVSNEGSEVIFIADGTEIYSLGLADQLNFQFSLNGVKELTIKVIHDDPNSTKSTVMWDVALTEVNTGQKIINSIKEKLSS